MPAAAASATNTTGDRSVSSVSACTLCDDVLFLTFNGLSKAYRACPAAAGEYCALCARKAQLD